MRADECIKCGNWSIGVSDEGVCGRCTRGVSRTLRAIRNKWTNKDPVVMHGQFLYSCRDRGVMPLEFAEWMQFWGKPCAWCGSEIETIGIDRIDNKKPYTLENCQPMCSACNMAKGPQDNQAMLQHIALIAKNNPDVQPKALRKEDVITGFRKMWLKRRKR